MMDLEHFQTNVWTEIFGLFPRLNTSRVHLRVGEMQAGFLGALLKDIVNRKLG
jgi:hypothetical protein